jgi:hypothetical protein
VEIGLIPNIAPSEAVKNLARQPKNRIFANKTFLDPNVLS